MSFRISCYHCLRWPFFISPMGHFTGVCKLNKIVYKAVRHFSRFRIEHRKFCENITCNMFRELLMHDPQYRDVYNWHPYHFTEICTPLHKRYADFIRLYGTPHLKKSNNFSSDLRHVYVLNLHQNSLDLLGICLKEKLTLSIYLSIYLPIIMSGQYWRLRCDVRKTEI